MFSARATHGFLGFVANNILLYHVICSKLLFESASSPLVGFV